MLINVSLSSAGNSRVPETLRDTDKTADERERNNTHTHTQTHRHTHTIKGEIMTIKLGRIFNLDFNSLGYSCQHIVFYPCQDVCSLVPKAPHKAHFNKGPIDICELSGRKWSSYNGVVHVARAKYAWPQQKYLDIACDSDIAILG
jgi:hypothetical protein